MATAFAALVSLHNSLCLIYNHPRHSFSFEMEQIHSLGESVYFMIEFMESFDDSHGAIKEAAEALESRIACAVQAAEDVIESHIVDHIRRGSTLGGKTRSRFLLNLQKAIQDVDFVKRKAANVRKLQSEFRAFSATATASSIPPLASEKNIMVGFDDELHRLLDLLTGVPPSRQVISIVGMGGIGKTTLARNALQHPLTLQYFDVCLWATVSQEFSIHKILSKLLSALLPQINENNSLLSNISNSVGSVSELSEELYKSLYGRRYLIILDDMWSVEAWHKMKFFFPDTSNGSRIVVTTRQTDVARHLGSVRLGVSLLDEKSSWDLFCEKTFEGYDCPPELVDIGKKIVGKCRGLPLAIVVIGGHLRKSRTEYWEEVANDLSMILNTEENEQCLNILYLSYRHLPVHLKPCFLFLGVFEEDQEIRESELLNLWIVEGLIQEFENCSSEEVARSYLWDLIRRNLVSDYADNIFNNSAVCRIHDLLRELCLKIAEKEEFFTVVDTRRAINRKRRIIIKAKIPKVNHQPEIFLAPRLASPVRSLICEGGQLVFNLKLLRVLKTSSANAINFQQVNLRYLKADTFNHCYLPSSISLLWNLQTLIIGGACQRIIAPYEIWEMLQLRHIEVPTLYLLEPLPHHILDEEKVLVLEKLDTLSNVLNFRLSEGVCRRIPNIRKLDLSYSNERSLDYTLHNLGCFEKLDSLRCCFDNNAKWRDSTFSLTFPSSLRWLSLSGCRLGWEELNTKVGSLPHLEILWLSRGSVIGSEWTLVEGGFPRLRTLVIDYSDLINWNADKFHFPVLQIVVAVCMPKLDEFPLGFGEIPTLEKIILRYCSLSSSFSAMRMAVEQEELGNEGLQLEVYLKGDEETLEGIKQKVEEEGLTSHNVHLILENVKV